MAWRINSQEAAITISAMFSTMLLTAALLVLLWQLPWQALLALGGLSLLLQYWWWQRLYRRCLLPLRRMSVQLEAMQLKDYALRAVPAFPAGIVADCQQQLNQLGDQLQQQKTDTDAQSFLLYRLIQQLDSPVLVLNHKLQLVQANGAFTRLFGQPWQSLRHASPALLGLNPQPEWHFTAPALTHQWQIRHSQFNDQGQQYQLLVCVNIAAALKAKEQQTLQQLLRVLSHEIGNSLTPVAALTANLQQQLTEPRQQQALEIIAGRCQHLQEFIRRYARLKPRVEVRPQQITLDTLFNRITSMFPTAQLQASGLHHNCWADPVLLEQVLLNMVKNAIEAGSPPGSIELQCSTAGRQTLLRLLDRGQGILNPDNLFVPFYSTKHNGEGIGLSLSRYLVEQMHGSITLQNRPDGPGACVELLLPRFASVD